MSRSKLIIGIPAYGRTFTLASSQKGVHAPGSSPLALHRTPFRLLLLVNGAGYPGRYTKTRGFLSYYEVRLEMGSAHDAHTSLRSARKIVRNTGKRYGSKPRNHGT